MYIQNATLHQEIEYPQQRSESSESSGFEGMDNVLPDHKITAKLSRLFETLAGAILLKIAAGAFLVGVLVLLQSLISASMGF